VTHPIDLLRKSKGADPTEDPSHTPLYIFGKGLGRIKKWTGTMLQLQTKLDQTILLRWFESTVKQWHHGRIFKVNLLKCTVYQNVIFCCPVEVQKVSKEVSLGIDIIKSAEEVFSNLMAGGMYSLSNKWLLINLHNY
jgi:hypothetical protein